MNDKISQTLKNIKRLEAERAAELERLAAYEGSPKVIDKNDQQAINQNLRQLAEGTAVVVDLSRKRRKLQPNEIASDDQLSIDLHLPQIASGSMVIVPAFE